MFTSSGFFRWFIFEYHVVSRKKHTHFPSLRDFQAFPTWSLFQDLRRKQRTFSPLSWDPHNEEVATPSRVPPASQRPPQAVRERLRVKWKTRWGEAEVMGCLLLKGFTVLCFWSTIFFNKPNTCFFLLYVVDEVLAILYLLSTLVWGDHFLAFWLFMSLRGTFGLRLLQVV